LSRIYRSVTEPEGELQPVHDMANLPYRATEEAKPQFLSLLV